MPAVGGSDSVRPSFTRATPRRPHRIDRMFSPGRLDKTAGVADEKTKQSQSVGPRRALGGMSACGIGAHSGQACRCRRGRTASAETSPSDFGGERPSGIEKPRASNDRDTVRNRSSFVDPDRRHAAMNRADLPHSEKRGNTTAGNDIADWPKKARFGKGIVGAQLHETTT